MADILGWIVGAILEAVAEFVVELLLHLVWQMITWPFRAAWEWASRRFDW
ncbi:hypothetical protein OP10G_1798 [Fimbriimonas ginsengisoli Gsoil 348]|uniref:Uncharacterized protein n=1 Tax=Fimbriimonas ginsengisoli Gsoil 348 TaxID=661478 RepID=A0A068NP02_FIMGI|nr:hypothetical protein OP10G_1798 [Fimbriimonas ginsengisoli Gsoil 348]